MADLDKVMKGLERHHSGICADDNGWCMCPYWGTGECSAELTADAIELLKQYCGLTKALEQSNAVNDHLNAEIERLEKENGTLKLAVQSMPNWLDKKRPEVVRCKDCRKRRTPMCRMYFSGSRPSDTWFCKDGERKDGDGE